VSQPDEANFELIPPSLAVQAMRDNGYRNTAYAVAELIDNSVQAGATDVELLCLEAEEFVQHRMRRRIRQVAVLDNGSGMDETVLRMALQFGNGTHLHDRQGIGRFGMGLPSASISQCSRVDVWSWQSSHENALYSYIDLLKVTSGAMRDVPEPQVRAVPEEWLRLAGEIGTSGTLVVWSTLDRCMWRTGLSIINNSEFLIARIYRQFLHEGRLRIRLASYTEGRPDPTIDKLAVANDPGYLLAPTSTPAPYGETPMFQPDGDSWEVPQKIRFAGQDHEITIRFSLAKEEARNQHNAGATPHGKHAARNVGVSLVRARRELDMDQALVNTYDPRERWWGVEVEFPPSLDELFGVTNNKQSARHFSELAERLESIKASSDDWLQYKNELEQDEDPTGPLIETIDFIDRRLSVLRKVIEVQRKGTGRTRRRHEEHSPEAAATQVTRERQGEGHSGASDADEALPDDIRQAKLAEELVNAGLAAPQATDLAAKTISTGLKYQFAEADIEGMAFFTVRPVAGEIVIKINVNHPAYRNLIEVLEQPPDATASTNEVRQRLERASWGLKLLLMAWARFEDEQPSEQLRAQIQEIRGRWGSIAYRFLQDD
jgi:hypothetical protein